MLSKNTPITSNRVMQCNTPSINEMNEIVNNKQDNDTILNSN